MTVPIDPSRCGIPQRAASCGGEQISSAASRPLDTGPYRHPTGLGWRQPMIRRAAYLRAQKRGFQPGREIEDWLAARSTSFCSSRTFPGHR